MAIYYRPFLFEYLKAFIDGTLTMEIGLFTKGTQDYADSIIN